jgi:uncharacterized membrane protein
MAGACGWKIKSMALRFLIYGLLGWSVEIVWTGLGSLLQGNLLLKATTSLWMLPIYGLAVFLEPLHEKIRTWPWTFRGLVWVGLIWSLEFFAGFGLKFLLGSPPWDYGLTPYSFYRLIRVDYAPLWFLLGLLFERLHDWLRQVLKVQ